MLLIQESWVNRTRGNLVGETEPYESRFETPSEAYRGCRKLYGRCVGRVYVDGENGEARPIGWIFLKRAKYDDARSKADTYLQETWITLHSAPPVRSIKHNYVELNARDLP
jgi:hypothetical protein